MSKLPLLSGRELCKLVEKLGFRNTSIVGSHHVYKHVDGRKTTIPVHANEQIGPGLLLKIVKNDLKLSREAFLELLK